MSSAESPARRGPWRRTHRTQVQWVELYTRQSLYLLLWVFQAALLLQVVAEIPVQSQEWLAVSAVTLLLTAAATPVLHAAVHLYPAPGPTPWRRVVPLLAGSGSALAATPLLDGELRQTAPLLVWLPLVWSLAALRSRAWGVAVLVLAAAVPASTGRPAAVVVGLLAGLFVLFTVRVSLWLEDVVRQLDRARSTRAELAVAEERLRFSRDVHDVLGRRLATIAVQSELAATLAARGDERAAEQMLQVRAGAHEALAEARDLARGYRASDLTTELEGARSLLRSAGIDVTTDTAGLPPQQQEPAAWVVRESVTNVPRHSRARTVALTWDGSALVVTNDGVSTGRGDPLADGHGSGLLGLRERLRPLGGDVTAAREGDRFTLRADLGTVTATGTTGEQAFVTGGASR